MAAPDLIVREARFADLAAIVALFAADKLGGHDDTDDPAALQAYAAAFAEIAASPCDTLYVAESGEAVVGTFQVTMTRTMTGRGGRLCTVEAVQTRADRRSEGIGAAMMAHAIAIARARGARLVQLMSNKQRTDAHRFYERLGFTRSHEGFKLKL